jgi:hypothetical protein
MLNSIITSETRIKLLLRFFLNPKASGYLRQLAKDFNESTNGIRVELNKLSEAKMLVSKQEGRNKVYQANTAHPLFQDIRSIVLKSTGIDRVISDIIKKIGPIKVAFLRGDYAVGKDSGLIELVLIGNEFNMIEVERVRKKTEILINRKISILNLTNDEYEKLKTNFNNESKLILFRDEIMDEDC